MGLPLQRNDERRSRPKRHEVDMMCFFLPRSAIVRQAGCSCSAVVHVVSTARKRSDRKNKSNESLIVADSSVRSSLLIS